MVTTDPSGSQGTAPLVLEWRELASGCGFTEGPVHLGDEVFFVSLNRGLVYAAKLDGSGVREVVETGGGPNGLAVDARGGLWIAQNGGRVMDSRSFVTAAGLQRVAEGELERVEVAVPDPAGFDAPNDCAFGPDGRLYLTDPHGRLGEPRGEGPMGRVWAIEPSDGSVELIADGMVHPNGLAFTADGSELWVSDTKAKQILALSRSGSAWSSRLVDTVPWGGPDGIAIDSVGTLWAAVTDAEGIAVRSPEGEWSLIELGQSFPTNVAFVGEDLTTLVVTAARGGRLLAATVGAPGLPLYSPSL